MAILDLSLHDRPPAMNPLLLERQPFLLRHGSFSVVDGDTIWALSNTTDERKCAFSMRFRSIAAPEKHSKRGTDLVLKKSKIDPAWDSAGSKAKKTLQAYLDRRCILVEPTGRVDKYGRMLCDISVVPYAGKEPDLAKAVSLEHLLLSQKVVSPFDEEVAPPLRPQSILIEPTLKV